MRRVCGLLIVALKKLLIGKPGVPAGVGDERRNGCQVFAEDEFVCHGSDLRPIYETELILGWFFCVINHHGVEWGGGVF